MPNRGGKKKRHVCPPYMRPGYGFDEVKKDGTFIRPPDEEEYRPPPQQSRALYNQNRDSTGYEEQPGRRRGRGGRGDANRGYAAGSRGPVHSTRNQSHYQHRSRESFSYNNGDPYASFSTSRSNDAAHDRLSSPEYGRLRRDDCEQPQHRDHHQSPPQERNERFGHQVRQRNDCNRDFYNSNRQQDRYSVNRGYNERSSNTRVDDDRGERHDERNFYRQRENQPQSNQPTYERRENSYQQRQQPSREYRQNGGAYGQVQQQGGSHVRSKYEDPRYHPQASIRQQYQSQRNRQGEKVCDRMDEAEPSASNFDVDEDELESIFHSSDSRNKVDRESANSSHQMRNFNSDDDDYQMEAGPSHFENGHSYRRQVQDYEQNRSRGDRVASSGTRRSQMTERMPALQNAPQHEFENFAPVGTSTQFRANDINSRLETLNVSEELAPSTSSTFHPRLPPADRTRLQKVPLTTNHFCLKLNDDQEVFRYDVNVEIVEIDDYGRETVQQMCRGPRDDGEATRRHELVRLAVRTALEAYRVLDERIGAAVYDDAAILFTNHSLTAALKPHNGSITIAVSQLPERARKLNSNRNAREFRITIQPCTQSAHRFTLGEAKKEALSGGTEGEDRSLRQFLELLTNQSAQNSRNYIFYGKGKGFLTREDLKEDTKCGHEKRYGVSKGIHLQFGETRNGKQILVPALVLDAKTGTFFKSQSLVELICEINGWRRPDDARWNRETLQFTHNHIKGIRLKSNHTSGTFLCAGLHTNDENRAITILECIEPPLAAGQPSIPSIKKYANLGYKIRLTNWPMVVAKIGTKRGAFFDAMRVHPAELLHVCEHQRVPLHKALQDPDPAQKPHKRWSMIQQHMYELDLADGGNSLMSRFGVQIAKKGMQVEGFKRQPPQLTSAGGRQLETQANNASWRTKGHRFVEAAHIVVLFVAWNAENRMRSVIEKFAQKIRNDAQQKGMRIDRMQVQPEPTNLREELATGDLFKRAVSSQPVKADRRKILVIYIDPEKQKTHGQLKLAEIRFQVITQHITLENVKKALEPQQSTLVENILLKMNVKMLGLNHSIVPESFAKTEWFGDSLIFGYDVSHPTGLTAEAKSLGHISENPSVVGFSANVGPSRDSFVGDFAYQDALRERVNEELLTNRVKWILKLWRKNRSDKLPSMIFVFRDGVSEGQYKMVQESELWAMKRGCEEFEEGYMPRFVLIICTKRHNTRFAKERRIGKNVELVNAEAMTVVDTDVVRPDMTEFFAQTHTPVQGTGKMTKYELLVSDLPEMTQDTLQSLTIALAFQHQITAAPISLPEPVYQADEWAKRGNDVFKAYRDLGYRLPHKAGNNRSDKKSEVDWEKLTQDLCYMDKPLDGTRVNA